jgi:hypothetical protein
MKVTLIDQKNNTRKECELEEALDCLFQRKQSFREKISRWIYKKYELYFKQN